MNTNTLYTVWDLSVAISDNLHVIRSLDFDTVIGIPRSGVLASSLISTLMQTDLGDLYSITQGVFFGESGLLKEKQKKDIKILLVEDSAHHGNSMAYGIKFLVDRGIPRENITTLAVFISEYTDIPKNIDICLNHKAQKCFWQWNWMRSGYLNETALDMDGVLCRDMRPDEDDGIGEKALYFYKTAELKYKPLYTIPYIITGRREEVREVTENWLRQHGILYDNLIMYPSGSELSHARYKSNVLNSLNNINYYIESSERQAEYISKATHCTVFCIDSQKVIINTKRNRKRG